MLAIFWAKKLAICLGLGIVFILTSGACSGRPGVAHSVEPDKSLPSNVHLTLMGFNYTDRYINEFEVDGYGGGNLYVSSRNGGGGGNVCCVSYYPGSEPRKVRIRWQADACTYQNRLDIDGTRLFEIHSFFKEVEVPVNPKIPSDPQYFEVHFFPDGRVEAVVTKEVSAPRLVLDSARENRQPYPECPGNTRPPSSS